MTNHDIRFDVAVELKQKVDTLRDSKFRDIVKTRFYEKVFLLGFSEVLTQLTKQTNEEVVARLMKLK